MCGVYLIIFLFGLFVVGVSSDYWLYCEKADPKWKTQTGTVYNIENCTNTEIFQRNFKAKSLLTHIHAANNQISRISDDTFKSAKELTIIDLRENEIEQISVEVFKDQGKLQHLYLKQNKLTRIEVGTFDSLTELKELWLQNNQLTVIDKGLFDKNTKLNNLYMDENKIIAIESKVFRNLHGEVNIHLLGNLCSNENFQSNRFDRNFACFESYESLKKQFNHIHQPESKKESCDTENNSACNCDLESQSESCNKDKLACATEKNGLKIELTAKLNEVSTCETSLNGCEIDLAATLKSKESESTQQSSRIRQLESQTETCKKDKLHCVLEKNSLSQNLIAKSNDLSTCKRSLSGCETKKSSINLEKKNLAATLESCNSDMSKTLKEKSTCTKEKDKALKEKSDELWNINNSLKDCQREKDSSKSILNDTLTDLEEKLAIYQKSDISFYFLIGCVTVELLVIIIFVWNCLTKKGKDNQTKPNNVVGESHPAAENLSNGDNLIYATLDLKPTKKAPTKTDEVIYSTVQRVSRPNESAPAVSRGHKKK
jgi:Leucine-rich repeat (LRR) protein